MQHKMKKKQSGEEQLNPRERTRLSRKQLVAATQCYTLKCTSLMSLGIIVCKGAYEMNEWLLNVCIPSTEKFIFYACHRLALSKHQVPRNVLCSPSLALSWAEGREKINQGLMS